MKLSEMREVLAHEGIQLTKSLGQNFLHDQNQLRRIAAAAGLSPRDRVLEIGPGLGPLTGLLVEQAGFVLAVEKDRRLISLLRRQLESEAGAPPDKWELLHADALEFLKHERRDWSDWKVVSNLPYSVASPILVELACGARAPKLIVATLQLEVARRLMAGAGEADYGVLTLLLQLDYEPGGFFKVPAGCFFPEPDVDSACVVLRRRPEPLLPEELRGSFQKIVKRAFSQRRKMMFKLLKEDWPQQRLEPAFGRLNVGLQERAEKLSLLQFVRLTEAVAK